MNYQEIVNAIDELLAHLDDNQETIDDSLLDELVDCKEQKIDSYCIVLTRLNCELEGEKEKLAVLSQKYKNRIAYLEREIERLKARLTSYFEQGIMQTVERGTTHKITFRNYPKVQLKVGINELPEELVKTKVTQSANLTEIKKLLNSDRSEEVTDYACLEDNYKPIVS